jgi:suppressor of ftsI
MTIDMTGMAGMGGMHRMSDGTMMMNSQMMNATGSEKIEWEDDMAMMNAMSLANVIKWKLVDTATKKENMHINDWKFKTGEFVKIKIFNDPKSAHPMQHPIHIHGQRFLVLATNGVRSNNLVWKDTTLIQKGDTVEILVEMKNPGIWMVHCHIAEHLESGMMFNFKVE